MNNRIFILVALMVFAFSACKEKEEKRELLTERIEYDVTIDNEESMESFLNNVDAGDRLAFLEFLFNELSAGKAVDAYGNSVDEEAVKNLLIEVDTNWFYDKMDLFQYIRSEMNKVRVLRFREKWTYNPETYSFYKEVIAVAPAVVLKDSDRVVSHIVPLFWVNCDTVDAKKPVLITDLIICDALVQNNTGETVKLYGESPGFLHSFDASKREKFFMDLKDNVASHKLNAYDYFFKELGVSEAEALNDHMDTVYVPDTLGNLIPYEYEVKILPQDFTRLKFVEKWEYSTNPFVFKKTVMVINPSVSVFDDLGEFQGYRPLFWIVFDTADLEHIKSVVRF